MPSHTPPDSDAKSPADVALQTLKMLDQLGLPPIPLHYAVWFCHQNKTDRALSTEIEKRIQSGPPIDENFLHEMHTRYIAHTENLNGLNDVAEDILDETASIGKITDAIGESARDFRADIDSASGKLESGSGNITDINLVINALAAAAQDASKRNAQLESELKNASSKITSLKQSVKMIALDAHTDFLTKLNNRRYFDKNVKKLCKAAAESNQPMSLVISDIDHFKAFNDKWGHKVGDQVLKLVASVIRANIKGQDLVARYGGEEFAIALPNTSLADTEKLIDMIRVAISKKKLLNKVTGTSLGRVTMSFGIVTFEKGVGVSELMERADAALYEAKDAGRNCLKIWNPAAIEIKKSA